MCLVIYNDDNDDHVFINIHILFSRFDASYVIFVETVANLAIIWFFQHRFLTFAGVCWNFAKTVICRYDAIITECRELLLGMTS